MNVDSGFNLVQISFKIPLQLKEAAQELARLEKKNLSEVFRTEMDNAINAKINAHYTRKVAKLKLAKMEQGETPPAKKPEA